MQARIMDTRLDPRSLEDIPPRRELYSDFVHVQSEPAWLALRTDFPASRFAIAAGVRLAQLHLRRSEVDKAQALFDEVVQEAGGDTVGRTAFEAPTLAAAEQGWGFEAEPYRFEARRMSELLAANRHDRRYGDEPLVELARVDPRRPGHIDHLLELVAKYPDSSLADNLLVRWANASPDASDRARSLRACIERFPVGDALPEALFRLADLETQALARGDESRRVEGIARMRELVDRFEDTCWGMAAAERLEMLEPRGQNVAAQVAP
jgi:hypothetical protein